MSETATCREGLKVFCRGTGLDIGFGGDPIVPWAITIDQRHETRPNVLADVSKGLPWFETSSLDFVFSSHCLEDIEDTRNTLCEWLRVIKPGGFLVLFLPDQWTYVKHCEAHGTAPNQAHKHADFSLAFVKERLPRTGQLHAEHWPWPGNPYSFALVVTKKGYA